MYLHKAGSIAYYTPRQYDIYSVAPKIQACTKCHCTKKKKKTKIKSCTREHDVTKRCGKHEMLMSGAAASVTQQTFLITGKSTLWYNHKKYSKYKPSDIVIIKYYVLYTIVVLYLYMTGSRVGWFTWRSPQTHVMHCALTL